MASGCKVCPLRGEPCRENCAWCRLDDGRCAVWQIADKLTDLENIIYAVDDATEQLESVHDDLQTVSENLHEISENVYNIWRDNGK